MNRWSTPRYRRACQTCNRPAGAYIFKSEERSFCNQGETTRHDSLNQYRRGSVSGWWHPRITVGLLRPTAHTMANQDVPLLEQTSVVSQDAGTADWHTAIASKVSDDIKKQNGDFETRL